MHHLYDVLKEWPTEDREDYVTLHVRELNSLFVIARNQALDIVYKRLGMESRKAKQVMGHNPGSLNKRKSVIDNFRPIGLKYKKNVDSR